MKSLVFTRHGEANERAILGNQPRADADDGIECGVEH